MKKIVLFILITSSIFAKDCKFSTEKELKEYMISVNKTHDFVQKTLEYPRMKNIKLSYKKIRKVEEKIDHLVNIHYKDLSKKEIEKLLVTKLKIYENKKELYYNEKALKEIYKKK